MTNNEEPIPEEEIPDSGFMLPEVWYKRIKWFVSIVLPAFGTMYFALSDALGLPYVTQVLGAITAVSAFLGTIMGFSSRTFTKSEARYDGTMTITGQQNVNGLYSLELKDGPSTLDDKSEVVFKVENQRIPPPAPEA